ncbi:alpha/beta fold hydrolase [Dactylosporangium cerinum]|uniref:Alpha/beta fold hydrolase n=1 Tax=Dactylosporangium cerinum TaxID=1434730 RepID=A0ABV9W2S5_9ACTN
MRTVETALDVVALLRAGQFTQLQDRFAAPLRAAVSGETVRMAWQVETDRRGAVRAVGPPATEPMGSGLVRVSVPVTCERGGLTVVMSVDGDGRLHGLRLAPATEPWTPPRYARTRRFAEHDVTLGTGPLAVAGTVSLPRGRGTHPGVVLLSGGGPFDRDATTGANKPLKDLAWGLASRGVAVLRFDKVTHTHPHVSAPGFTVFDEYVPHAVAAVDLLRRQPAVDPGRVFVLGHSLGGKVAPRVAAADPAVAGLVLLAAEAQPMQRSAERVVRYLAALRPGPESDAAVATITRQAALVDGPLTPATPAADLPFGLPASFWLDLRDHDPVTAAAALDVPMLLVQGARDYQVTVADDLTRWRSGLAHRPDVTFHVHDAGNHLFFPGKGPSTPAEYEPAQHVDRAVVSLVAEWVRTALPGGRAGSTR